MLGVDGTRSQLTADGTVDPPPLLSLRLLPRDGHICVTFALPFLYI